MSSYWSQVDPRTTLKAQKAYAYTGVATGIMALVIGIGPLVWHRQTWCATYKEDTHGTSFFYTWGFVTLLSALVLLLLAGMFAAFPRWAWMGRFIRPYANDVEDFHPFYLQQHGHQLATEGTRLNGRIQLRGQTTEQELDRLVREAITE